MELIHNTCEHETTHGEVCSACGTVLVAEQMTWVKTWRNERDPLVAAGVLVVN